MLVYNMTLKQMLDFHPSQEDMAMLALNVETYIKVSIVSLYKETNYDLIRNLFTEEFLDHFHNIDKTVFYDFDGLETKQERFVTIFELYSILDYKETAELIKKQLIDYDSSVEAIFDLYTHDDKLYRLSYLDDEFKLEEVKEKIILEF